MPLFLGLWGGGVAKWKSPTEYQPRRPFSSHVVQKFHPFCWGPWAKADRLNWGLTEWKLPGRQSPWLPYQHRHYIVKYIAIKGGAGFLTFICCINLMSSNVNVTSKQRKTHLFVREFSQASAQQASHFQPSNIDNCQCQCGSNILPVAW